MQSHLRCGRLAYRDFQVSLSTSGTTPCLRTYQRAYRMAIGSQVYRILQVLSIYGGYHWWRPKIDISLYHLCVGVSSLLLEQNKIFEALLLFTSLPR